MMKNDTSNFSKKNSQFVEELLGLLESITYGSLEVYVQDKVVTQITVRNIRKTKVEIKNPRADKALRA